MPQATLQSAAFVAQGRRKAFGQNGWKMLGQHAESSCALQEMPKHPRALHEGCASAAYALDSARAVPLAQRLRIEEDWNCAGSDGCRSEDRVASQRMPQERFASSKAAATRQR